MNCYFAILWAILCVKIVENILMANAIAQKMSQMYLCVWIEVAVRQGVYDTSEYCTLPHNALQWMECHPSIHFRSTERITDERIERMQQSVQMEKTSHLSMFRTMDWPHYSSVTITIHFKLLPLSMEKVAGIKEENCMNVTCIHYHHRIVFDFISTRTRTPLLSSHIYYSKKKILKIPRWKQMLENRTKSTHFSLHLSIVSKRSPTLWWFH